MLLLATPDDSEAPALQDALGGFGYRCQIVRTARDIPAEILRGGPGILLADISETDAHLKLVRKTLAISHLPLILVSARAGFEERLKAVKSGAAIFLPKPFDVEDLVERLGSLDESKYERPYRVVIAEDDGPPRRFLPAHP